MLAQNSQARRKDVLQQLRRRAGRRRALLHPVRRPRRLRRARSLGRGAGARDGGDPRHGDCPGPADDPGPEPAPSTQLAHASGEPSPAGKRPRTAKKVAIAAALIVLLAAGGGAGYYFGVYAPEQRAAAEQEAWDTAHSSHALKVCVMSTGWDTSSGASKLPVHVTGTDLDGNDVDEVAYVDSAGDGISLVQGDYTLSVAASPLGSEGDVWGVPQGTIQVTVGDALGKDEPVDVSGDAQIPLGDPLDAADGPTTRLRRRATTQRRAVARPRTRPTPSRTLRPRAATTPPRSAAQRPSRRRSRRCTRSPCR